jgi:hypothetical protein
LILWPRAVVSVGGMCSLCGMITLPINIPPMVFRVKPLQTLHGWQNLAPWFAWESLDYAYASSCDGMRYLCLWALRRNFGGTPRTAQQGS